MSSMQPQSNIGIRVSLQGQAETVAGLNATTSAAARLRRELTRAGESEHLATIRHQAYNQAWFTVRRLIYGTTLALGAASVGVVAFGLKFNASMQQNMVAFTHFLGSSQAATDYLNKLYDLAATTPFEFQGLAAATKRLIAFGYSGEQAYRTMVDIGDAAAGLGVSQEGIDRMTLAFGQMRTNGRILGGELRQLSEVGINARKYLQAAFNLTPDQMANIGALHIPAEKGIEAILRGIEKEFGGFAVQQSTTFTGLLSTIHDYAQKLFGTITQPLFQKLSDKYLPRIVSLTKDLSEAFVAGGWGAMALAFDKNVGAGGKFYLIFQRISSIMHSFWIILTKEIWPSLVLVAKTLAPFLLLLWPIGWALQVMANHSTFFGAALKVLIVYLFWTRVGVVLLGKGMLFLDTMLWRTLVIIKVGMIPALQRWIAWSMAATYAQGGMGAKIFTNTGLLARFSRYLIIGARNMRVVLATTWASSAGLAWYSRVLRLAGVSMKLFTLAVWGATRAMVVFLFTNPVGWAILIISTLVILYMKWGWFHDKVNAIFFWIKNNWPLLGAIILGPFSLAALFILRYVNYIWKAIQWVWNKAQGVLGWIRDNVPFAGAILGDGNGGGAQKIMGGSPGGAIAASGNVAIGRTGRRDLNTFDSGKTNASASTKETVIPVQFMVNKRVLAEGVIEHKLYKDASR